jgi:hypothetical protein
LQVTGYGGDARGLAPGGEEGLVVEGFRGTAAPAEASAGGSGFVVELAGDSEGLQVLADGGFRDAELAGELSQGEGTAASPSFPAGLELQGVDGGGWTASHALLRRRSALR